MSKIPQGEWNAIAARYAQGESISAIARTYGCTPPAIHYILKNNRRRAAPQADQPVAETRASSPMVVETAQRLQISASPGAGEPNRVAQAPAESSKSQRPPATGQVITAGWARREQPLPAAASAPDNQHRPFVPQQPPRAVGLASAGTEGLDSALHDRAEAAIETFRSCFDAALAAGSPRERARLREAASNLMRVAARTTIVLDRLNALSERSGFDRGPNNGRGV
jgi:transposase-like protein